MMKAYKNHALLLMAGAFCALLNVQAHPYQFGKTPNIKRVKLTNTYYPDPLQKDASQIFKDAQMGYVEGTALTDTLWYNKEHNMPAWNMPAYSFIQGESPSTVHPTLWTMEKLNNINGLFQVWPMVEKGGKDGFIYQVRSYDLSTMSVIKGKTGWIVVDPLAGAENAAAAWKQFKEKVDPKAKISAIIFTHSHVDHYRGVTGLIDAKDVWDVSQEKYTYLANHPKKLAKKRKGKVLVIAPNGFYNEAMSENLLLGNCMQRRAMYMYGIYLPADTCQHVGTGLGKMVHFSSGTLLKPSFEVKPTHGTTCELLIDGLHFLFQNVPDTEAPAEFHFLIKEYKTLCPGENVCHTMHNLLTPRGAKVRNAKAFGDAIDDAMQLADSYFDGDIQVLLGVHHWPTWGNEACRDMMSKQRDMYYFFNNQVIHLLNKGMSMDEIADTFALPPALHEEYYNRGFYGTVNHNAKAVAQFYTGWWDGNPATYFEYPDQKQAKRVVADMGGEDALLKKAHQYFDMGDYRWTIELTKHLIFYNPLNMDARYLQADALEQLGYSFEAGTWRNMYLSGALDLRNGSLSGKQSNTQTICNIAKNLLLLQPQAIFDYLAVMIDGQQAAANCADVLVSFKIDQTCYQFHLYNGVLHAHAVEEQETAITFRNVDHFVTHLVWRLAVLFPNGAKQANTNALGGSPLDAIYQYVELFDPGWNIVEPL